MISAGKLDRVLTVERSTTTTVDANGTPQETWQEVATLRGELVKGGSTEDQKAYGTSTENALTFRTRFLDGLSILDRLIYAGRAYDIRQLTELGRRRGWEIFAVAVGP